MTSQPQLSTSPVPSDESGAATGAVPTPHPGGPAAPSTDLIVPDASPPTTPATSSDPADTASTARGGLWARLGSPGTKPLLLGFLGSLLLAAGGVGAGGVLVHDPILTGTPLAAWRFGHGYDLAVLVVYLGLALEVWGWMLLGRDVLARRAQAPAVLTTSALWLLPMLVTPPLFTRDEIGRAHV